MLRAEMMLEHANISFTLNIPSKFCEITYNTLKNENDAEIRKITIIMMIFCGIILNLVANSKQNKRITKRIRQLKNKTGNTLIQGSLSKILNKIQTFFRMGTFIDSTHMKL